MSKIFKRALASACAVTAIITSGVVASITASAKNNCSDSYWFTEYNPNSMYHYDTTECREKMDASSIYVNNSGWSDHVFYGTQDLRVWVSGHLKRSGYSDKTYNAGLPGPVRIEAGQKRFIYQYVYENADANAGNWPKGTYKPYANLLIQADIKTAGQWSPDSVGWYPAADLY